MNKWARQFEWGDASAKAAAPAQRAHRQAHYFAFLSYSHKDEEEADWLHRELERFRVPASLVGKLTENGAIPRRLTPIFRDRKELAASDDLGSEIREALAHSRCMIVLCSPAAARSKWTNAEIDAFKKLHPDGCIIAAVVAGEPHASGMKGREEEECFPPALLVKYDRRGRPTAQKAEPLAADLRHGKDGRREGFLKIVAGILGVGLDDLVQREEVRRQRRLAGITAASVVGMLVAGGLAVTAIQARDAARDQRREAESLVEFMIGDLQDKLQPIGRLDVLDGVGSRVLEYYSKQDTSELSDQGLAQRSKALTLMGRIAQARGNIGTALALYRQAHAGTAEAVRRNPDDPQALYEHSLNVFYIGDIARARGDQPALETAYREYKQIVDRMAELEPNNLKWRAEQQSAAINLGILLYSQRRYADAAKLFHATTGPLVSIALMDPENGEYQAAASTSLAWTAQAQWALGELDAAIASRKRQAAFLERLLRRGMNHVEFRQQLLIANQALGLIFSFRGQTDLAVEHFQEAVAHADRLIQIEPENAQWKGFAAGARLEFARALITGRRFGEAAAQTSAQCSLAREVRSRNSGASWRRLETGCFETQARLALNAGATAEALPLAKQALTSARSESDVDPVNDRYSIATQSLLLGDVYQRMGDRSAAVGAWTSGLRQLPRKITERPMEIKVRGELVKRLEAAGKSDRSQGLAENRGG